jgi:hypothetical protein
MKKIILALGVTGLGFASCNKEVPQRQLTKQEIQQKVDSITSVRMKQADENAKRDLQLRITIEVKAKSDSIVNAKLQAQQKDTAAKAVKKVPNAAN